LYENYELILGYKNEKEGAGSGKPAPPKYV
jgi:hypothetical protein